MLHVDYLTGFFASIKEVQTNYPVFGSFIQLTHKYVILCTRYTLSLNARNFVYGIPPDAFVYSKQKFYC